jgi:hypothetical protein
MPQYHKLQQSYHTSSALRCHRVYSKIVPYLQFSLSWWWSDTTASVGRDWYAKWTCRWTFVWESSILADMIDQGRMPSETRLICSSEALCALSKNNWSIRPIAVGCFLNRLVAIAVIWRVSVDAAVVLQPHQPGVNAKQGTEAMAHSTRCYLENVDLVVQFLKSISAMHSSTYIETYCHRRLSKQLVQICKCLQPSYADAST